MPASPSCAQDLGAPRASAHEPDGIPCSTAVAHSCYVEEPDIYRQYQCRRQHSPTAALADHGPAPPRPGGACPPFAAGRAAYAKDLLLRKFAHLNPRPRRPKNVSHLIDAARRPALDQVTHLWIADRRAESTGKVRPQDGERTLPQSDRLEGQPRRDLEVVKRARYEIVVPFMGQDLALAYETQSADAPTRALFVAKTSAIDVRDEMTVAPIADGGGVVTRDANLRLLGPRRLLDLPLRAAFGRIGSRAEAGLAERLSDPVLRAAPERATA